MDLVHILAFQALKFWKSLRQSTNRTLYNTFMCFRRERDYMILLRTYSCTTTDSIGILKKKLVEHYTSICATREVTGWLSVFLFFSYGRLLHCMCPFVYVGLTVCILYYYLSVSVCLSPLHIVCFYCHLANKRVHNSVVYSPVASRACDRKAESSYNLLPTAHVPL